MHFKTRWIIVWSSAQLNSHTLTDALQNQMDHCVESIFVSAVPKVELFKGNCCSGFFIFLMYIRGEHVCMYLPGIEWVIKYLTKEMGCIFLYCTSNMTSWKTKRNVKQRSKWTACILLMCNELETLCTLFMSLTIQYFDFPLNRQTTLTILHIVVWPNSSGSIM